MTRWLDRIAARLEPVAIPHLTRAIVGFNALVFLLHKLNPGFLDVLVLDPAAIFRGEVWRLATYIFIPQFGGSIFPDWFTVFVYLAFLWFVGEGVEAAWGAARMNLYYLVGMAGTTLAALIFGAGFSAAILNTSLFFAFARLFPDTVIYLLFVLPVRVKWMAWLTAGLLLVGFLAGSWAYRGALLAGLANYLLFFGPQTVSETRTRASVGRRRKRFEREMAAPEAFHRCEACGATESTAPEKEFRVAADGHEYCREHLPKPPAEPSEPAGARAAD
jgi:hypothetical protein